MFPMLFQNMSARDEDASLSPEWHPQEGVKNVDRKAFERTISMGFFFTWGVLEAPSRRFRLGYGIVVQTRVGVVALAISRRLTPLRLNGL